MFFGWANITCKKKTVRAFSKKTSFRNFLKGVQKMVWLKFPQYYLEVRSKSFQGLTCMCCFWYRNQTVKFIQTKSLCLSPYIPPEVSLEIFMTLASFDKSLRISFKPAGTEIVLVFGLVDEDGCDGGTEFCLLASLCSAFFSPWASWWCWWGGPPPLRAGCVVWLGWSMLFGRLLCWRDLSL